MKYAKLVRRKYKNAYSIKHDDNCFTINSGEDKDPEDAPYRMTGSIPHGWGIGKGVTLIKAWKAAYLNLSNNK